MDEGLLRAVEACSISAQEVEGCIDDNFGKQTPKVRIRRNPVAIKKDLESEFLTPPTSFGLQWLDRLQQ